MATADEHLQPWQEDLLGQLRQLGKAADPVPTEVVFAAKGSIAWRRIDADLAELTFDSSLDDALATVRGGDAVRLLTFEAGEVSVEVEVSDTDGHRRVIGQLVPPQAAHVEVRAGVVTPSDGTRSKGAQLEGRRSFTAKSAVADELGRFALSGLDAGPTSLRCRLDETGQVIETGWLVL